jgi:hypothetical protein
MYQWLTTAPNPRASDSAQPTGWRLHAVPVYADQRFTDISRLPSVCGLIPTHGWGLDLFITERCARCAKTVGPL